MTEINFHKPLVYLYDTPGVGDQRHEKDMIILFDNEEDMSEFYLKSDTISEYNAAEPNAEGKVELFGGNIDIRKASHEWLVKHMDEQYADWCLNNNWMKLDKEAGLYVCGDDIFDDEFPWDYCPLFTDYNECDDNKDCPYTGCPLHE